MQPWPGTKAALGTWLLMQPTRSRQAAPGCRGFSTFVPPPPGCTGWRPRTKPAMTASFPPTEDRMNIRSQLVRSDHRSATMRSEPPDAGEMLRAEIYAELSPEHLGPLRDTGHLKAAVVGDVRALKDSDEKLREALQDCEDIDWEEGQHAFRLYKSSLAAFDPSGEHKRRAFHAAANDDIVCLRALLESGGVAEDATNAAGQTLLEVARERHALQAQQLLQRRGWRMQLSQDNKNVKRSGQKS